jgi:hypothetical protein
MSSERESLFDTDDLRKSRVRSPNFPILTLPEAIEKLKLIYKNEKRAAAPGDVLVSHFGYKQMHGKSGRVLSAIRQYGLLDEKGGLYRVSDLGYKLLHLPTDSEEYTATLKVAATYPPIYQEVMKAYPDGLPSNPTLQSYLILNMDFNPSSVARFVHVFRDTMEFANINPDDYIQGEIDEAAALSSTSNIQTTPIHNEIRPYNRPSYDNAPVNIRMYQGQQDETALVFKISQTSEARIMFSGRVKQEAVRKLIKLLDVSVDTFPTEAMTTVIHHTSDSESDPNGDNN